MLNCIYCAPEKYSPNYSLLEHWTEVNGKPALYALRLRSDGVAPRAGLVSLVKVRGSCTPGIELWFFEVLANNLITILTELRRLGVGSVRKGMGLRKEALICCDVLWCGLPKSTQGRGFLFMGQARSEHKLDAVFGTGTFGTHVGCCLWDRYVRNKS